MTKKIKIAIVGAGNCAVSLVEGIHHYKHYSSNEPKKNEPVLGIMNYKIGGYAPGDIEVVAAFDVDKRKVGKRLDIALRQKPNCAYSLHPDLPKIEVIVQMAPALDGISEHMKNHPSERTFLLSEEKPADVEKILKESGAEILVNYLPVGSEKATRFWADTCLKTGVSMINCMPVFIASNKEYAKKFEQKGIPIVGDDIKAQIGATIVHRTLTKLFTDRGVKIDRTYQLNTGGNTDFLNMLNRERLASKKISKTSAVQSQLLEPLEDENIHIGPSDYVPWQNDNKVCYLRMEGRGFGGFPVNLELRLSVEDSPNSAGVSIDAIRCCQVARERKVGGILESIAAYTMKHPPKQYSDSEAKLMVSEFIEGKRER